MISFISALCQWLTLAAGSVVVGTTVFRHICLPSATCLPNSRFKRVDVLLYVLPGFLLVFAHLGKLTAQISILGGFVGNTNAWYQLLSDTHVGRVWVYRAIISCLLLASILIIRREQLHGSFLRISAGFAALYLVLGPLGGHAAGAGALSWTLVLNIAHVLAVAIWMGALPLWVLTVRAFANGQSGLSCSQLEDALTRFSWLAIGAMCTIVLSGALLADTYINNAGDLLGTLYGGLLVAKFCILAVVLLLANGVRRGFLPQLRVAGNLAMASRLAARHVAMEFVAAIGVLGCAAWLGQTTPALHDASFWWLPFRWALDAAWIVTTQRPWILTAAACLAVGLLTTTFGRHRTLRQSGLFVFVTSAVALAWILAVKAYPDSYRRSESPYLTASIAEGRALFQAHCIHCHGGGGLGDGPLASSLPKIPANLTQPHTALHTVGDVYWWLTHGIQESGMPGFGKVLSTSERWDLINFLRAFSQGFEGRLLSSRVVSGQAWLGAPNFYIEGSAEISELKNYRGGSNVLLVFLDRDERSAERIRRLVAGYPRLQSLRTAVLLVVPMVGVTPPSDLPFPVLGSSSKEIWDAYELLSRTASNRGAPDRLGMDWARAEFLIDRFGYVRARWIPEEDRSGWDDLDRLFPELVQLNAEPQLKPSPDDHVH
ncbi:hypothetical protein AQB9606_03129 [Aquabacterium sp. CECT 9606]|nr:hypothetical protein AQB9606_03129 [Aquabacterium sp. CECT 9606]